MALARACTPWYPTIFPEKCDGCAPYGKPRCVEYCPNGVFAFINGKAVVANPHKCVTGCTACEPVCHKKSHNLPKTPTRWGINKNLGEGLAAKNHMQKVRQSLLDKQGKRPML